MELKGLMGKNVKEMTEEELEQRISFLTRSKVKMEKTSSTSTKPKEVKSNKDRQLTNLLSTLSKNDVAKLIAKLS